MTCCWQMNDRLITRVLEPGGVGHDSQSVPREILSRAHFLLIAKRKTSRWTPCAEGDVEISLIGGSLVSHAETNFERYKRFRGYSTERFQSGFRWSRRQRKYGTFCNAFQHLLHPSAAPGRVSAACRWLHYATFYITVTTVSGAVRVSDLFWSCCSWSFLVSIQSPLITNFGVINHWTKSCSAFERTSVIYLLKSEMTLAKKNLVYVFCSICLVSDLTACSCFAICCSSSTGWLCFRLS